MIIIKNSRRPIDENIVIELADSIRETGLLNPIIINKDNVLIAGAHRLEACRKLGWEEVDCNVVDLDGLKAELAEIDENLVRNELHYLERGKYLNRRKRIYELLHPEAKAKVAGAIASNAAQGKHHASEIISFASDTASKTGVSDRTIQQEMQIADNLVAEAQEVTIKKSLTKNQALKLAREKPEEQKEIVELIAEMPPKEAKAELVKFFNQRKSCTESGSDLMKEIKKIEAVLLEKYEEYKSLLAELGNEIEDYQPIVLIYRQETSKQDLMEKQQPDIEESNEQRAERAQPAIEVNKDDEVISFTSTVQEPAKEQEVPRKKKSFIPFINRKIDLEREEPKKKLLLKLRSKLSEETIFEGAIA